MNVEKCLRKQNEKGFVKGNTFTFITMFAFYDIFELVNLRFLFFIHAAVQNEITDI